MDNGCEKCAQVEGLCPDCEIEMLEADIGQSIASLCQQIKGLPPEKAEDFQNWIGIRIVLYRDPNIAFRGKITGGIRCRAPNPAKVKPQAMQQSEPEPEQFDDPTAPPDDGIPF